MAALFVEKKQRLTQTAAILKKPLASRGRRCYNNKALGGVAHLGERLNGIQEVVGSIPIISTKRKKGTVRCLFLLVPRHLALPNAARCGAGLPGRSPGNAATSARAWRRFALCVVFAEFAFGKLVSLPGLCPGNASFPAAGAPAGKIFEIPSCKPQKEMV